MKELLITPPAGYEIDRENSTFEKIVFKEVKKKIEWSDFGEVSGFFVGSFSNISHFYSKVPQRANKNTFPTREEAEACLALSQLLQWRNKRNEGWKPDWTDALAKYCILFDNGKPSVSAAFYISKPLHFKDRATAEQFLEDFRDLIEVAKPLL